MQKLGAVRVGEVVVLCVAVICSAALTIITMMPPVVRGDWARLDKFGKYIPNVVSYNWPSYALQFCLWLGLMLALCWAFANSTHQYIPNIPSLRNMTILIAIILLGFGLRLYTLDRLPLIMDEIGFAARASDMLHGQHIPIFAPGHNGNPAVFSWLIAGSMDLFAQNRFAMRLISLAFGTLSIPAAYALGRVWWSQRVGLVAAAFLATYPAHVYFSRLALYNIVDPFFAMLTLAVLARALRRMRLADFALAGALAGIAQYFYHGSHMLPVLMIVYVGVHTFNAKAQGRKDARSNQSPQVSVPLSLCIMLFVFALISLPRFAPMFTADLPLTGNLNAVRLPADLGENAVRSVLAWVGQPDVSPFWLSSAPLLPVSALIAGGVGLVIGLRHLRDPRHMVIVATSLLTTIFGGVIWTASPLYVRYMTALPAIVLLVALPFEWLQIQRFNHRDTERKKIFRTIGLVMLLTIIAQGIIVSLQQPAEAIGRVPAGLWEQDRLAQSAAHLATGTTAKFKVSSDFGAVDRITIADYVAAYGQRRSVTITTK